MKNPNPAKNSHLYYTLGKGHRAVLIERIYWLGQTGSQDWEEYRAQDRYRVICGVNCSFVFKADHSMLDVGAILTRPPLADIKLLAWSFCTTEIPLTRE